MGGVLAGLKDPDNLTYLISDKQNWTRVPKESLQEKVLCY